LNSVHLKSYQETEAKFQALIVHLIDLINSTFLTFHSNRTISNVVLMREFLMISIVWLRLLCDSFLNGLHNFELSSNFLNILSTINGNLKKEESFSKTCFLYYMQNDSVFCNEYLSFIDVFNCLLDEKCMDQKLIVELVIKTMTETNAMLIRHLVSRQINLQMIGSFNDDEHSKIENVSFKIKLTNLLKTVRAIDGSMKRSPDLYESVIREILDFLCNDYGMKSGKEMVLVDNKLAELFKLFDLKKTVIIMNKYFDVGKYFS
jgi:hypothetical protein